jgi:adenylate cyclase
MGLAGTNWFAYTLTIPTGLLVADGTAERDTAEALAMAEQSGDDLALDIARTTRGVTLVYQDGPEPEAGLDLLATIRERALNQRFSMTLLPIANICTARYKAQLGEIEGAIEISRAAVEELFSQGVSIWSAPTVSVFVESLLCRGSDADLREARTAIDRLAALPTDPGYVLHEIWLLRLEALLAQAHEDKARYRHYRDRYRERATSLGFEGHVKWAEAMP